MDEPRRLRVGNAEREWAVTELGEHLAQGRLDPDEYADRAACAYAARTDDELDALFVDLPRALPGPRTRRPVRRRPAQRDAVLRPLEGRSRGAAAGAAVRRRPLPGDRERAVGVGVRSDDRLPTRGTTASRSPSCCSRSS